MDHKYLCPTHELSADFFAVAKRVYQHDENWIREDEDKIREQFSEDNQYFNNCESQVYVYKNDARLVGFFNPDHKVEGEKVVYFGFWETKDDLSINQKLFSQLETWAQEKGAQRIYGPINFTTFGAYRLRTNDFNQSSFIDEPYNPQYYLTILAKLGYEQELNYSTAFNRNLKNLVKQIEQPLQTLTDRCSDQFIIEHLTADVWMDNLQEIFPLVEAIFRQNFAYSAISWQSFKAQCGVSFAKKLCPRTSVLIRDKNAAIAGFFLTYPDYGSLVNNSAYSENNVKEIPRIRPTELNYEEHYPLLCAPRMLLGKTCGVDPKYRSCGLFTLMSLQLSQWAADHYEEISGAMMRQDNASMSFYTNLIKAGNKDFKLRNYSLYSKSISETTIC